MKKFLKNKFIIIISIAVLIVIYIWCSKAIRKNNFSSNEELITENIEEDKEKIKKDVNLDKNEETIEQNEEVADDSESEDKNIEAENKIFVYITGEVNNPGIVKLDENSRIIDAINSAGGTTSSANISKINLAYVLKDGMKVNIPNKEDLKNNNFEYITMSSGDGKDDDISENENSLSSKSDRGGTNKGIVNINIATQTELETLPGIGPSTALKIINYRNENGKFSSIDEIKNVNGIGDSKFENIKKYITV